MESNRSDGAGSARITRRVVLLLVLLGCGLGLSVAQDSGPEEEARLEEQNRLVRKARALRARGELEEALEVAERILAVKHEASGEIGEDVAETLEFMAEIQQTRGDYEAALDALEKAHEVRTVVFGEDHWEVTNARCAIRELARYSRLGPEDRERLREARDLNTAYLEAYRAGKTREAIALAERTLAIRREVLGDDHRHTLADASNLGALHEAIGAFDDAERYQLLAMRGRLRVLGEDHPVTAGSRNTVGNLYERMGEDAKAEALYLRALEVRRRVLANDDPSLATTLADLVRLYRSRGENRRAQPLCREALEIRKMVLGENHPDTADSLNSLALIHDDLGEFAKAEQLYRQALEIWKETRGTDDTHYATVLSNLAELHRSMGETTKAERLCRQALEIRRRVLGEEHPATARSLDGLALVLNSLGDHAAAESLFLRALEIRRKVLGEDHLSSAESMNNLACLYEERGEYEKAEPLFQRALEIKKRELGENHASYATTLGNLATLYCSMGDLTEATRLHGRALAIKQKTLGREHPDTAATRNNLAHISHMVGNHEFAEQLYRQTLEVWGKTLGEEHPTYAVALGNLAHLYESMGEYEKAEQLCRQALELRRKVLGERHPHFASSLNNLAHLHAAQGKYEEAAPLYHRALEIREAVLGENHRLCALTLNNLAVLYESTGEFATAEPLCRRALDIHRESLDTSYSVQSEKQQLEASGYYRGNLDAYLSLTVLAGIDATEVYARVLPWKGAIFARQARTRIPRGDPEVARLFEELELTGRRLATCSLETPDPDAQEARHARIRELTERKEKIERELSRKSEGFRKVREAERLTPGDLQRALPPGVLLLDFLEYERLVPSADGRPGRRTEPHLAAFVVPPEGEVRRVELGPSAPIAEAVENWRASLRETRGGEAGRRLRVLLWPPIAEHLRGTKILLVSPDEALNRISFAALPGRSSGTYLVEELSVAVVAVPQLLPGLLAHTEAEVEQESLLLVGDVDYGADPGEDPGPVLSRSAAGAIGGTRRRFRRLPATEAETLAIRKAFLARHAAGTVVALSRGRATEAAFRSEAPTHRWLHLATHGYFAPPGLRSALSSGGRGSEGERPETSGNHPGLLSGLALSGANTPPAANGDDGILTALEVASLDLSRVELAVLSACKTGLGEVSGGEGVLGLQRAFQVAGARTTVTSLWSVPDRATRALMERFYGNLWGKGMTRLEALRDAQLWLLREGSRMKGLGRGPGRPESGEELDEGRRLPPYHWAAFVLGGDWR